MTIYCSSARDESALDSPAKQGASSPSSSMARGRRSTSAQKDSRRSSSAKSLKSPNSSERPPSTRQNREIAQLLQMDFGPGKTPFKVGIDIISFVQCFTRMYFYKGSYIRGYGSLFRVRMSALCLNMH